MASKKAGRLAGLAALAGLAYMANEKGKGAGKPNAKVIPPDRDDADRYLGFRAPIEDERPAPTGMGEATKLVTPAEVARSEKAPSAADLGAIRDEAGTLSRFRRNTETGELYDPGATDGGESAAKLQSAADRRDRINANVNNPGYSAGMKKGGKVKKMASGGMISSASKRGDGIAQRGKTKGRVC